LFYKKLRIKIVVSLPRESGPRTIYQTTFDIRYNCKISNVIDEYRFANY